MLKTGKCGKKQLIYLHFRLIVQIEGDCACFLLKSFKGIKRLLLSQKYSSPKLNYMKI